ncbi:alkaline phosphatase family protein [Streptosporangium sp. CA-135522]|uniref:alkaline phosphatase family protein n=1 Tax=Streptosporangium sp. CA-135522 TaxID=3240072 RepID=UPI003D8D5EE6
MTGRHRVPGGVLPVSPALLLALPMVLLAAGCGPRPGTPDVLASRRPSAMAGSAPSLSPHVSMTLVPTPEPTPSSPPPRPKVLVVGLDGVRYDRVLATKAVHFRQLMRAGTFTTGYLDVLEKVHSSSGPGWSTVLTGVTPDKHGVYNNSFVGRQFTKYPDFLTRLETIRPSLHTAAVTAWRYLLDTGAVGALVDWHATGQLKPYEVGAKDAVIVDRMTDLIRASDVDVAFMHLEVTDAVAHRAGVLGPDYRGAIETVDGYLGRLFGAVRARPAFASESWTIIVTTDHGHKDEGGHGGVTPHERMIFLLAAGPGIPQGVRRQGARQVDVAATVFTQLGIPLPESLDGKSLSTIRPIE